MDLEDVIKQRKSTRSFSDEKIMKDMLITTRT